MSLHERLGIGLIVAGGAVLLTHRALESWRARTPLVRPTTPHGNPLPRVLHAVLPQCETQYRRVIVVGDVHGCPEELQALLDKLAYRKGADLLLSVGDLVNKGPDSEKVLKMARELGMRAVRGNHDDAAYEAFRAWLDGRDLPKPAKHHWVPGLDADLAELLRELPFTLELPAYGVVLVHAGLVPGVPLLQQRLGDLEKVRDVVPACEELLADVAAADLAAGASVDALPTGAFDWEACTAALAAADAQRGQASGSGGAASALAAASGGSTAGTSAAAAAPAGGGSSTEPRLPQGLRLVGREHPNPLGRAWASVWRGPRHVLFGHDAKRRLQLHPAATGLDTGCVYGGQLTAAVLPPLDEHGRPVEQRLSVPPDARELQLCTGLTAHLVSVPAKEAHSQKMQSAQQQLKTQRQELAKLHTERELAAQQEAKKQQ